MVKYTSPIRLFDHAAVSLLGELNISRIRKQVIAEFGLSPSGIIDIGEFHYNKNDVLAEIDHPDFIGRLRWHQQVWERPAMLQMLEEMYFDQALFYGAALPFYTEEGRAFLSPYFAFAFEQLSRSLLQTNDLDSLGIVLPYTDLIEAADREAAFRPIRIYLDENIRVLRNINKDNYPQMSAQLSHWIKQDWSFFINHLPDEYYDERVDLATYLVNVTVSIQKTFWQDCYSISLQLSKLEHLPASLNQTIMNNHSIYANHGSPRTVVGSDVNWRLIVFGLLVAVRILLAMQHC